MTKNNPALDQLVNRAAQEQIAGRLDSAVKICYEALAIDPDCMSARFIIGVASARKGDTQLAIEMLNAVLTAEATSFEALMSLSTIYFKTRRGVEAKDLALRAVEVRPKEARAHSHLGACQLALRQLSEAENSFRIAISLEPGLGSAYHQLGRTLQLEGKYGEAAGAFFRSVQLSPAIGNQLDLGKTLLALGDVDKADSCARACMNIDEKSVPAHLLMCSVLIERKLDQEAESHLRIAMALDKDGREAFQIAALQRTFGLVDEANNNLRLAIKNDPSNVLPYKSLIYSQKVGQVDRPLVDALVEMLETKGLSPTELVSVHYSLGKAFEDLGECQRSMQHFDEANCLTRRIKLGETPFDRARYSASIDKLIESFSMPHNSHLSEKSRSELPILILGMMRSGTTLAEQIVSSHPDVSAAGEQPFWIRNCPRILSEGYKSMPQIASEYIDLLASIGHNAKRVTDKMPGNYRFIGLIHRALPNAHIIHMRRSPLDTCLSIWATTNELPNEGGHDKGDIVFVYKEYLRLMQHWRKVIPADRLLEVDYEELIANGEQVTRRILDFCGLEWNDVCLRPDLNERVVTTPSQWQVRQPVYKTSMGRGRKFEPWLGEFAELLELESVYF